MFDRRLFLKTTGAGMMTALAAGRAAAASPRTDSRLVMILLRGGLDGLHALPPYADSEYQKMRPTLALSMADKVVDLDGYFGLHPALEALKPLYSAGELLFMPAVAARYRDQSHSEAQNMLENGSGKPFGAEDGWLNRAILGLNPGERELGLSLGPTVPLILQGEAPIQSWGDDERAALDRDFLFQVGQMYRSDPLFMDALQLGAPGSGLLTGPQASPGTEDFIGSAKVAAQNLSRSDGARIAVMELQGWDTHFDQARRLEPLLAQLAQGITTLKDELGPRVWRRTAVVVVSEFGRSPAENDSQGTDHGDGGLAIMAGGAVRGGRIVGHWPGLTQTTLLNETRSRSQNAYESMFKAVLIDHLDLDRHFVEDKVFPNSGGVLPHKGLLHFS
ncbi:DUF1501 domain-containing protein [Thalassovita mangrovi]|uniref:DUF1501 domain-containing protein n=1 Tax=Thalassovita mangrovi TaxID=2692236 RepID=A0A6L8LLP9_9RHOB|nr:DUF1501 domain-containing protein [Thalassovita mangrovi]MYM56948.1 DUF1501 domain-containing protein [Thalassovita mangrovi]